MSDRALKSPALSGTLLYPLAFFFVFAGAGAFQQFYRPCVIRGTGASETQASLLLALVYFALAPSRLLVGGLARRIGEYGACVLGAAMYVFFPAALLLTDRFAWLAASCVAMGFGGAILHTATPSLMLDAGDARRRRGASVGTLYFWLGVGFSLGVALLAVLRSLDMYRGMAVSAVALTVLGVLAFAAGPRAIPRRVAARFAEFVREMRARRAWLLAAILFGSSVGYGLMLGAFFDRIGENRTLQYVGLASFYVLRTAATYVGGRTSDRFGRARVLRWSFLFAGAALLVAGVVDSPWAWAACAVALGLQSGVAVVVPQAIVGDWAGPMRRHIAIGGIFLWRDLGMGITIFAGVALRELAGGGAWVWAAFGLFFILLGWVSSYLKSAPEDAMP
ncbi:MAG: MFS transporter [Planctomycetota bacterium]